MPAPTGAARPPWFAALDRVVTALVAVGLMAAYQHFGIATPSGPDADAKVLVAAIEKRLDEIATQVKSGPGPGPSPAPDADRLTNAARAYLTVRPKVLRDVATQIREERIKPEDAGDALFKGIAPASAELTAAIKAQHEISAALDRAADVMQEVLK